MKYFILNSDNYENYICTETGLKDIRCSMSSGEYGVHTIEEVYPLLDQELSDRYDDMLDECYPDIEIGSLRYSPSHVLKNVDEIAYRCGYNDWLDSEVTDNIIVYFDNKYFEKGER